MITVTYSLQPKQEVKSKENTFPFQREQPWSCTHLISSHAAGCTLITNHLCEEAGRSSQGWRDADSFRLPPQWGQNLGHPEHQCDHARSFLWAEAEAGWLQLLWLKNDRKGRTVAWRIDKLKFKTSEPSKIPYASEKAIGVPWKPFATHIIGQCLVISIY